jgi:hypothetical protein
LVEILTKAQEWGEEIRIEILNFAMQGKNYDRDEMLEDGMSIGCKKC